MAQPSKISLEKENRDDNRKFKRNGRETGRHTEGLVFGAMALALYLSRALGTAPLRMKRARSGGWSISVSTTLARWSYAWVLLLHVLILTGLFLDLGAPPDMQVMVRSTTGFAVWLTGLLLIMSICSVGVFNAPKRMSIFIECLHLVRKINPTAGINEKKRVWSDIMQICFIVFLLCGTIALFVADLGSFFLEVYIFEKEPRVMYFYTAFYVEVMMVLMLQFQFAAAGMLVDYSLESTNQQIENFIRNNDLQANNSANKSYCLMFTSFSSIAIPIPKFNNATQNDARYLHPRYTTKDPVSGPDGIISSWAHSYSVSCNVLRLVDKSYSLLAFLILGYTFIHLAATPFFLIVYIMSKIRRDISIGVQVGYIFWNTIKIIFLMTTPGRQIQVQMLRMKRLLSQVLRRMSPDDSRLKEVECFFQQLMLHQQGNPPGIRRIRRPTIIAMFAGINTYLTIVVQLLLADANNRAW